MRARAEPCARCTGWQSPAYAVEQAGHLGDLAAWGCDDAPGQGAELAVAGDSGRSSPSRRGPERAVMPPRERAVHGARTALRHWVTLSISLRRSLTDPRYSRRF